MCQTISLRRLASTTACSTVCFWFSSALTFWPTCSASAFNVARRSSVVRVNSWSLDSAPSFFSTSLTFSVTASASSRVSRVDSRIFAFSCANCVAAARS